MPFTTSDTSDDLYNVYQLVLDIALLLLQLILIFNIG